MKRIKKYMKNLGKGLVTSLALLIVVPILLIAAVLIPLVAALGQDISDNVTLNEEEED